MDPKHRLTPKNLLDELAYPSKSLDLNAMSGPEMIPSNSMDDLGDPEQVLRLHGFLEGAYPGHKGLHEHPISCAIRLLLKAKEMGLEAVELLDKDKG